MNKSELKSSNLDEIARQVREKMIIRSVRFIAFLINFAFTITDRSAPSGRRGDNRDSGAENLASLTSTAALLPYARTSRSYFDGRQWPELGAFRSDQTRFRVRSRFASDALANGPGQSQPERFALCVLTS